MNKLIQTIKDHEICLPLDNPHIPHAFQNTFSKLIFEKQYASVLKVQEILMKNVRNYYKMLCDNLANPKKSKRNDDSDLSEDYEIDMTNRYDVKEALESILRRTTKLPKSNTIDLQDSPKEIFAMIKGFIHLGGYFDPSIYNIEFERKDEKKEFETMLSCIGEKNSKTNDSYQSRTSILDIMASSDRFINLAYEIIDMDSPASWVIDAQGPKNLFEYACHFKNIDLVLKLLKSCEFSKVMSKFPLHYKTTGFLLNSGKIFEILMLISTHEEEIKALITKAEITDIPYLR